MKCISYKRVLKRIFQIILVVLIAVCIFLYFLPYIFINNEIPKIPYSWYDTKEEIMEPMFCSIKDEELKNKYSDLMYDFITNKYSEDKFESIFFKYIEYFDEESEYKGECQLYLSSSYLKDLIYFNDDNSHNLYVSLLLKEDGSYILSDNYLDCKYNYDLVKLYTDMLSEGFGTEVYLIAFSQVKDNMDDISFNSYLENLNFIALNVYVNKNIEIDNEDIKNNSISIIEKALQIISTEDLFVNVYFYPTTELFLSDIEDKDKFAINYIITYEENDVGDKKVVYEWRNSKLDYSELIGNKVKKGLLYLSEKYPDDTFEVAYIEDSYYPYDGVKIKSLGEQEIKYHTNYNLWYKSNNLGSLVGYSYLSDANETTDANKDFITKLQEMIYKVDLTSYSHIQLKDLEMDTYVMSKYIHDSEVYYKEVFSKVIDEEFEVYCEPLIYDSSFIPLNIFTILSGNVNKYNRKVDIDTGFNTFIKSKSNPYIIKVVINKNISNEEKIKLGQEYIDFISENNINSSHIRFFFSEDSFEVLKDTASLNLLDYGEYIYNYKSLHSNNSLEDLEYNNFNIVRLQNGIGGYKYVILE